MIFVVEAGYNRSLSFEEYKTWHVDASIKRAEAALGAKFNSSAWTLITEKIIIDIIHKHKNIFLNMETPQNIICRNMENRMTENNLPFHQKRAYFHTLLENHPYDNFLNK